MTTAEMPTSASGYVRSTTPGGIPGRASVRIFRSEDSRKHGSHQKKDGSLAGIDVVVSKFANAFFAFLRPFNAASSVMYRTEEANSLPKRRSLPYLIPRPVVIAGIDANAYLRHAHGKEVTGGATPGHEDMCAWGTQVIAVNPEKLQNTRREEGHGKAFAAPERIGILPIASDL
ncbi:hypothetical protein J7T55_012592 [Diaporthe amygdali]|uniref:uncharacterized protein n=1 Tax=Phomopsis amygdali TaxID=1214568 RepID=UPI0022FF4450|nr:uncharacterized protein J7T55_012592 [Diaporthe amygdali]KAJ0115315.1 hypothetical protein J7T55_012592 [Diaporthe amygdali]